MAFLKDDTLEPELRTMLAALETTEGDKSDLFDEDENEDEDEEKSMTRNVGGREERRKWEESLAARERSSADTWLAAMQLPLPALLVCLLSIAVYRTVVPPLSSLHIAHL